MSDFDFENENEKSSFGFGSALFNVVAIFLIVGACGIVALLIFILLTPDNFLSEFLGTGGDEPTPTLVAVAFVPTLVPVENTRPAEPTATVEPTIPKDVPATNTPLPLPDTPTPVTLSTPRPTLTSTLVATLPANTSTPTNTPTPTDTATPGPPPTITNTRSPFPFTKTLDTPQYVQNRANLAGCSWMGIGGQVFNINHQPVAHGEYRVHVWLSDIDERVVVGDATAYGPSGYERMLYPEPRFQEQNIQLETANGTAVSQVYRIQTRTSCNENLVVFDFIQNH